MPERFSDHSELCGSAAASCEEHAIGNSAFSGCQANFECAFVSRHSLDTAVGAQLDVIPPRFAQQAIDYRLGRISNGKHAAITFHLQSHATAFEPFDGIGGAKTMKRTDQRAFTA